MSDDRPTLIGRLARVEHDLRSLRIFVAGNVLVLNASIIAVLMVAVR